MVATSREHHVPVNVHILEKFFFMKHQTMNTKESLPSDFRNLSGDEARIEKHLAIDPWITWGSKPEISSLKLK
ncbi:hypothetical protein Tco_0742880 [Tanacetum coccineum]